MQEETINIAKLIEQRERGYRRHAPTTRKALGSWTEKDFLDSHCSGGYTTFKPVPRSTIAASFSPDGKFLASTHGDYTVKVVDCFTGRCVKVLEGHTRTPWVVRFHPIDSDVLASGSLDRRVVVWRVSTGETLYSHDFGKPIASIAFHPSGKALVVASGHKVYFWDYTKPSSPTNPNKNPSYILKTKRSLRALHFHPLGQTLLLTAEVVDNGPSHAPPNVPQVPAILEQGGTGLATLNNNNQQARAAETLVNAGSGLASPRRDQPQRTLSGIGSTLSEVAMRFLGLAGLRLPSAARSNSGGRSQTSRGASASQQPQAPQQLRALMGIDPLGQTRGGGAARTAPGAVDAVVQGQALAQAAGGPWGTAGEGAEVTGQMAAVVAAAAAAVSALERLSLATPTSSTPLTPSASAAPNLGHLFGSQDLSLQNNSSSSSPSSLEVGVHDPWGMQRVRAPSMTTHAFPLDPQPLGTRLDLGWAWESSAEAAEAAILAQQRAAAQVAHVPPGALLESQLMPLAVASEQPCIVSLNLWYFQHRRPSSVLDKSRISIPRAVLCSEMGTHFSPCGRFFALCVSVEEPSPAAKIWIDKHTQRCKERMQFAQRMSDESAARRRSHEGCLEVKGGSGDVSPSGHSTSAAALSGQRKGGGGMSRLPGVQVNEATGSGSSRLFLGDIEPFDDSGASTSTFSSPPELQQVETEEGFMVPVAQPWEVFPQDVTWLAFPLGTDPEAVRSAVKRAREAAGLEGKPLYELRIYSLEGGTFGQILTARMIRAAHCLTSVQFSPTSEHLLVAYGRRCLSLCNLVADGRTLVPAHTVMEIYDTKDLELKRVLPSLDDEVNVAAFHPVPGQGIVYGTKEGKLRMLRYDRRIPKRPTIPMSSAAAQRMDDELSAAERDSDGDDEGESDSE